MHILEKSILIEYAISLKDTVALFTKQLFYSLFDVAYKEQHEQVLEDNFHVISKKFMIHNSEHLWKIYKRSFLGIREQLDLDAIAFEKNDPACKSLAEVYLAYPGFHAIAVYRLSNQLLKLEMPILPRMMCEYVHGLTGTDIHPGAEIGDSFFIDHATGIVIGETTIIKNNVTIFQGVTLGGLQVKKNMASVKRHPTIENNVIIYANATILGGDVVIGKNSVIGANVCITESTLENSIVAVQLENKIFQRN